MIRFSSRTFLRTVFFLCIIYFQYRGISSPKAPLAWTTGTKKILCIRVDFADKPGESVSVSKIQELTQEVNTFYAANSDGKIQFTAEVTPALRMPHPAAYYLNLKNTNQSLITDGHNAALKAGYNLSDYPLEIVFCDMLSSKGIAWALHLRKGLLLSSDDINAGGMAHELGHNLGLYHANLWQTNDGSIIGNGKLKGYGNSFDIMGPGAPTLEERMRRHFSASSKYYLNWLPNDAVQTVTTSGTYRIFAHDLPKASGLRALRIKKG